MSLYREQQLRERIIKMATRTKEKTKKFESTIRNLMDENEALKKRIVELEQQLQQKASSST
jgi:cell division septum initiation protein DivIVA